MSSTFALLINRKILNSFLLEQLLIQSKLSNSPMFLIFLKNHPPYCCCY